MKPIHIMAGGPSNTQVRDVSPIICVNKDLYRYPNAKFFLTCDHSFTKSYRKDIEAFKGTKVFVNNLRNDRIRREEIEFYDIVVSSKLHSGFGRTWTEFGTGFNSGFSAVQFAILMGYNEIHMYGIDLNLWTYPDAKSDSHWHSGYSFDRQHNEEVLNKFFGEFKRAIESCEFVDFICHSKTSRLLEIKGVRFEP